MTLQAAPARRVVQPSNLDALMEIDHVIRVHSDGTVCEPADIWAPELRDGELDEYAHVPSQPTGWRLMNGYSGQWNYAGPIMHPSEFIGGRMERDILAQPGLYAALVNYTSEPADGCDDCRFGCEGHESLDGAHMGETVYCDGSCHSVDIGPCDEHDIAGWAVAYINEEV